MRLRINLAQIIVAVVTFLVLVASYWGYLEYSFLASRQDAVAAGRLRARQISEAARQQLTATFRGADYLLQNVRRDYVRSPVDFNLLATQALSLLPASSEAQIAIYGADGRLVVASGTAPVWDDVAERAFFKQQQAHFSADALVVGEAAQDPRGARWRVPLARALLTPEGFAGVIVMTVSPQFLSNELALVVLGENDTVGAVHLPEGTYLARSSQIKTLMGRAVKASRPYLHLQPGAPEQGVFMAEATHEPVERIYAWAKLRDLPVVIFVGLSTGDLLAPLNASIAAHRWTNLIGTLALLGLAAGLAFLAFRDIRQRTALMRQEALYRALFDQNHSVKLLTDPADGRILAANAAAAAFYGYTAEQLARMNISDINCLPREEVARCMAEAKQGERPSFVFPHRLASGDIRMVEVFSGPVTIGEKTALYSIIHDVTDRFELERGLRESEERYRGIFEAVPAGLILVDENGKITSWNETVLQILRTDVNGLVSRTATLLDAYGEAVPPDRRPSARCLSEDIKEELYSVWGENGRRIWLSVEGRRFSSDAKGVPAGAILVLSDITRAVQLEEEVLISERVFEAAAEGIMVTDVRWEIIRVNPAFEEITGYPPHEVIGKKPKMLAPGRNGLSFYRPIFKSLAAKRSWEGDITNRRRDGRLSVERTVVSAIVQSDGRLSGYVTLLSDVTARKKQEEEIWLRANFDTLTGLPNRTLLADRIEQALNMDHHSERMVGVLFIDLDRFKPVNDQWGHAAGDELLRLVARRISGAVRAEDTVARVGGDEFVVFLPSVSKAADVSKIANKILDLLRSPFILSEGEASISACVGVALGRAGAVSAENLIRRADAAMYRGKTSGRSRVVVFAEAEERVEA
ncbi:MULTISPECIES: PAS domain S-box protein [unclassified Xanthobacter]|uniref:sensor domain-containing diguanylate cyclase n=1 Tax=unclassified Xanthobacter TaxID=2623496 RepID=UPI001F3B16D9|nr:MULTISPECIES: PAS domain S-box protein [unclassified Xanthobacter]